MLPREPDVRLRQALRRRARRRDAAVVADHQAGPDRRDVAVGDRPDQFERGAQGVPRREARPHPPPERAARNVEAVGLASDFIPRRPRELDALPELLAANEVEPEIGLPGRHARVVVAGRQLHHPAERERRRLLAELRPQVELRAQIEVADVVAGPALVHPRGAIDDAPHVRVVGEQRPQIAIDPRVHEERSEELGAVPDADGERGGDVADVAEALDVVRAAPVSADRPLTVAEDFAGRNKPQSSVAEEGRCRRSRLLGSVRGRGLRSRWTLHRGCRGKSALGARAGCHCQHERTCHGYAS